MSQNIRRLVCVSQYRDGPLGPFLESFAKQLNDEGYSSSSINRKLVLATSFSHWLMTKKIRLRNISAEHPTQYLRYRARRRQPGLGDHAALDQLLGFLNHKGVIRSKKVPVRILTPVSRCVKAYEHYLQKTRGLARSTIVNYLPFIRQFLDERFGEDHAVLSHLTAEDIIRFVQRQAHILHKKRAKLLTTALRSFLRYAQTCGTVKVDLAAAVPVVANWSMTSIPRAIGTEQVQQLIASIDRHTAMGRRDFAVVLLLARLGLRSGEVATINLEDINWKTGQLNVRGKGGRRLELPLSTEVGQAIADYLRHGRPQSSSRRVFLRTRAPIGGFHGASGVGSIVRHTIERAGVATPTYGTHQFRHGLATEMLRQGASLSEIGEVLGHQHPQTTLIYTKVDIDALRTLAMPWPGSVR